jgi:hypothetical protein
MVDFTTKTNEELEAEYDRLWRRHMYYMAAEGNWSAEAKERGETEKEYWALITEMKNRNMEFEA